MQTLNERFVRAPDRDCFQIAADVERWPTILPHYRWVRFHEKHGFGRGRVEMAAWRRFIGPLRYPTWWVSEMTADAGDPPVVRYRHVDGITRGMDVRWEFLAEDAGTRVRIIHEWDGPSWPLIGRFAAEHVIGPFFVYVIADRTLAGIAAEVERRSRAAPSASTEADKETTHG